MNLLRGIGYRRTDPISVCLGIRQPFFLILYILFMLSLCQVMGCLLIRMSGRQLLEAALAAIHHQPIAGIQAIIQRRGPDIIVFGTQDTDDLHPLVRQAQFAQLLACQPAVRLDIDLDDPVVLVQVQKIGIVVEFEGGIAGKQPFDQRGREMVETAAARQP